MLGTRDLVPSVITASPGLRSTHATAGPALAAGILPALLGLFAAAIIALLPWPGSFFLLMGIAAGIVTMRWPEVGLSSLVMVIPIQAVWEGSLGTIHLTLTKTMFIGVVVGWIVRLLFERRLPKLSWLVVPYLVYLLIVVLSGVNAGDRGAWWIEVYHWLNGFLVYLIASDSLRRERPAWMAVFATAIGLIGLSCYGFFQLMLHTGPPSFTVNGVTRAYATFGQPNPFAGYLDVTVPFVAALVGGWILRSGRSYRNARPSSMMVGLLVIALMAGLGIDGATQSRGGWLGMVVGLSAVVWLLGGLARLAGTVLALSLVAAVLVSPLGSRVGTRMSEGSVSIEATSRVTVQNFAVRERLAHWNAGIRMALEHPWLGVGAGNFNANYRQSTTDWRFRIPRGHAHNAYIQAAAQTGFTGLLGYLALISAVGVRLWQRLRATKDSPLRPFVIGAVGVCLAFGVHSLVDYLHVHNLPALLGVVIAMAEMPVPATRSGPERVALPGEGLS